MVWCDNVRYNGTSFRCSVVHCLIFLLLGLQAASATGFSSITVPRSSCLCFLRTTIACPASTSFTRSITVHSRCLISLCFQPAPPLRYRCHGTVLQAWHRHFCPLCSGCPHQLQFDPLPSSVEAVLLEMVVSPSLPSATSPSDARSIGPNVMNTSSKAQINDDRSPVLSTPVTTSWYAAVYQQEEKSEIHRQTHPRQSKEEKENAHEFVLMSGTTHADWSTPRNYKGLPSNSPLGSEQL